MADNSSSGGMGLLGVIIGAAIVVGIAFFFMGGGIGTKPGTTNITVTAPSAPAAAPAPAPPAPKQ